MTVLLQASFRCLHTSRQIIEEKPFLRRIYHEWYATLAADIPAGEGRVLELGSGAGFFRDVVPETTQDVPAHRGFGRVEVAARKRNEYAGHQLPVIISTL